MANAETADGLHAGPHALHPDPPAIEPTLQAALMESRQRWRDFAVLAADLVFETDALGRFTYYAPDPMLGWPAGALIGQQARLLLAHPDPDPFMTAAPMRDLRVWLRHADASATCHSLAIAPMTDADGQFLGMRGTARDVTAETAEAESQAAAIRRAEALEMLVRRVRQEVLAPRMLAASLEALPAALGCAGAAVLEIGPGGRPQVAHRHGADPTALLPLLPPLAELHQALFLAGPEGESLVVLPYRQRHALLAWRGSEARGFDGDDRHLLVSLADLVFVALGNQTLQRELEQQARTDALTGLLNRRAFLEDLERRLARPAAETRRAHRGGALLFIDLDNFKPINDRFGHEAGDAALIGVARLLRTTVRPTDLVARIGGDEFAVWLQDADRASTTARATALCEAAASLPSAADCNDLPLRFSIGCAMHSTTTTETPDELVARADAAMYASKRGGRNRWTLAGAAPAAPAAAALAAEPVVVAEAS